LATPFPLFFSSRTPHQSPFPQVPPAFATRLHHVPASRPHPPRTPSVPFQALTNAWVPQSCPLFLCSPLTFFISFSTPYAPARQKRKISVQKSPSSRDGMFFHVFLSQAFFFCTPVDAPTLRQVLLFFRFLFLRPSFSAITMSVHKNRPSFLQDAFFLKSPRSFSRDTAGRQSTPSFA